MKQISDYLSIVIVTYNRAKLLDHTLECILNSPFQSCPITILDNCSTDNTQAVMLKHQGVHNNIRITTHKYNIGGDANIMRAVEYASTKYLWILADDDTYDFSECGDVIDILCNENVDLLHVGGHKELIVKSFEYKTPKDAIDNDYPYFKTCSFIPANIFKVELIRESLISGYKNIKNSYAHMPFFIKLYECNSSFYISKNKIVLAEIGAQNYTVNDLLGWWINTAYTYISNNDTRLIYLYSQFLTSDVNFKYIRILRIICSNKVDIIDVFQILLMKNFVISLISLLIAKLWNIGAIIKNRLLKKLYS